MIDSINVKLKVYSAHKLIKRSLLRNPNPFAEIIYNNHKYQTCVKDKTSNPIWDKSFDLELQTLKDRIEIMIWNHRLYSIKRSSAFLGSVLLTTDLINKGAQQLSLSRNNCFPSKPVRGFIKIEMIRIDNHFISPSSSIPYIPVGPRENHSNSMNNNNSSFIDHTRRISNGPSSHIRASLTTADSFQSRPGPSCTSSALGDSLLPPNFERKVSDGGKVYFIDTKNNTLHWYHPGVPKNIRKVGDFSCLGSLPTGWDSLQSESGRVYFIDHVSRTTQYTDPRLLVALEAPNGMQTVIHKLQASGHTIKMQAGCSLRIERSRSDRRKSSNTQPEPDSNTVVFHLENKSNEIVNNHSQDISCTHNQSPQNSRRSQSTSQIPSIIHTSSDIELSVKNVSEDQDAECQTELAPLPLQRRRISRPTSAYVLNNKNNIDLKLRDLRTKLKELMQKKLCIIETSRDNILEKSFDAISKLKPNDLWRRLVLKFTDEEGLDYGGVAREWLYLLSETLFSCRYGLFETNGESNGNLLRVSPLCNINENYLRYFHFIGRIIGMAIFHGYYIDADFCKIFYKSILNRPLTLEDFKELDTSIYNSLLWILENNIDDADLNLTFSIEQEVFGELKVIDLCENGRSIPVTDVSKKLYIDRYVDYNLKEKCFESYEAIKRGIYDVLPAQSLDNLNEDEFEVLLTGISEIKIEDWQKNTRLKHCTENEPLIKWFWEVVTSYTEQQRTKLLQFVTGSSRIPLSGFEGLRGSYGSDEPKLFTIKVIRNANPQSLPKAHTCFNRLDLPPYVTYKSLRDKLTCAIEETCGFAVM